MESIATGRIQDTSKDCVLIFLATNDRIFVKRHNLAHGEHTPSSRIILHAASCETLTRQTVLCSISMDKYAHKYAIRAIECSWSILWSIFSTDLRRSEGVGLPPKAIR